MKPCSSFFRFFLPEGDSSSRKGKKIPKQLYDPVALHDEDYEEDEVGEEVGCSANRRCAGGPPGDGMSRGHSDLVH